MMEPFMKEVTHAAAANMLVIDDSAGAKIRFFQYAEDCTDDVEYIGKAYIRMLESSGERVSHRRFRLRFFDENRTIRLWEHSMMYSESEVIEMGTTNIHLSERLAFCR